MLTKNLTCNNQTISMSIHHEHFSGLSIISPPSTCCNSLFKITQIELILLSITLKQGKYCKKPNFRRLNVSFLDKLVDRRHSNIFPSARRSKLRPMGSRKVCADEPSNNEPVSPQERRGKL